MTEQESQNHSGPRGSNLKPAKRIFYNSELAVNEITTLQKLKQVLIKQLISETFVWLKGGGLYS